MTHRKILFAFAVLALVAAMSACKGKTEEQAPAPKYELQELKPVDTEVNYSYPAVLKGTNDLDIYPQVDGRITAIHYETGAVVKKGQKLFSIESSKQQMQVSTDKASVQAAQAVVNSARLKLDSQKKLYDKKIVSEYVYRTAQNDYETAQAQLAQAKAQLVISQTELDRCTVVSPIDGIVNGKNLKVGALVGPTMQTPLTTVSAQQKVQANFSIPENLFASVIEEGNLVNTADGYRSKTGKRLEDFIDFNLVLSNGQKYGKTGKFKSMSGMVDSQTGTVGCVVEFENPEGKLHSGNSANVVIPMKAHGVFVIPQSACKKLQDKYLLYKVGKDGLAESVIVDVYPSDDGKNYIVTEGRLKAGDVILTSGVARVADGMQLK